ALTSLASPARDVKRKMSRSEAALLRFRQGSKQLPDRIERLDIGHRIRTRRPPDRRLIHQHHFVDKLVALQTLPRRGSPRPTRDWLLLRLRQRLIKNLMQQRRFSRARNSRNRHQHPQRNADVDPFQIVGPYILDPDL